MWKCIFPRISCIKITFADIFGTILWCTEVSGDMYEKNTHSAVRKKGQPDKAWQWGTRGTGAEKRGIEVIGMPTDSNWNTLMCGKLTDIEEGHTNEFAAALKLIKGIVQWKL